MKNQGPMPSQKNHNIPPVTKANDTEICDLPIKNSKKLFGKIQWAIRKQWKTIQQNQENNMNKTRNLTEIDIIKK